MEGDGGNVADDTAMAAMEADKTQTSDNAMMHNLSAAQTMEQMPTEKVVYIAKAEAKVCPTDAMEFPTDTMENPTDEERNHVQVGALWKEYELSHTSLLVGLILANLGLILYAHFGVSGVIFTSFNLAGSPGTTAAPSSTPSPVSGTPLDQCTAQDLLIWHGNSTANRTLYNTALLKCGTDCFGTSPTCIKTCIERNFGYSSACASCFSVTPQCTLSGCPTCISNQKGCECVDCVNLKCAPTLEACLGMGAVNLSACTRQPPKLEALPPLSSISTLYPAYDIGFGPSVKDAYNSGARGIAAIIVIFSGAWPYLKIIIMLTLWFAPLANRSRYIALKFLVRASKLTLVDVYAVIVIMAGVNIYTSVAGQPVLIKTETRGSIYSFLISSLLQLSLENWMMYLHNQKSEDNTDQNTKKVMDSLLIQKDICSLIVKCQEKFYEVSNIGVIIVFLITCASLGLLIAGMALPIISFRTVGLAATGDYNADYRNLTLFNLGEHSLSAIVMYEHAEPSGARLLVTFYYILGIALPLGSAFLTGMSFIYFLCFRVSMKMRKGLYCGISMIFSYSSIEVLLLATVVVMQKYNDLIERAVGSSATNFCAGKTGNECFGIQGHAKVGASLLILFGFILLWILQWIFAFMLSHLRLPDSYAVLQVSPNMLTVIRPLIREVASIRLPASPASEANA